MEIRAFIALAETGSFTAAAKLVGRDPTAISRGVQALERRLGVRLAERSTRAVTLTEAGRLYLSRVQRSLSDLVSADEEVTALGCGEPRGHLRVALPGAFGRLWLAPLVTSFLAAHPRITLDAHHSEGFVDLIGQGFDVAVRLAELSDSRLVARKVSDRRRLLCASPSYLEARGTPVRPSDIAGHDCLCFTGRTDPFRWTFRRREGSMQSVAVTPRVAADQADILVDAAVAGLGLFYTTDWHVGPLLRLGRLVEVMEDWQVVDGGGIYILTSSTAGTPVKTRAFSDWIAAGLSARPWLGP